MSLTFIDILIVIIINYLMISCVFYAAILHKAELLHCIVMAKSPKNRVATSRLRHETLKKLIQCVVWPYYVANLKNETKKNKA